MEKWRCDVTAKPGPLDPGNPSIHNIPDKTQPGSNVLWKRPPSNLRNTTHVHGSDGNPNGHYRWHVAVIFHPPERAQN